MDTTENVLGKNVIHAVSNPLRMFAGAIHIYAGTSSASSVVSGPGDTLEERPRHGACSIGVCGGERTLGARVVRRTLAHCAPPHRVVE
jgi:hypothetical protein